MGAVGGVAAVLLALGFGVGRATAPERPLLVDDELQEEITAPAVPTADASKPSSPRDSSVLDRFRAGLSRTSKALGQVFSRATVDDTLFEELEDALLGADVGVTTTTSLLGALRERAAADGIEDPAILRDRLTEILREQLGQMNPAMNPPPADGPYVILVVGVNGSGKTTTIGKLAARFRAEGKKVLLAAGDTYRAGAIEQLRIWANRSECEIVAHQENADPAAVIYDALEAAKARGADVVICDTAGRLQSQKPLMDQLGKVTRVIARAVPGAPHEVLLVLDGTIGQNALSQARTFGEVTGVTGVVLTKLDGTAKGGVVVAVGAELNLPVKFIGIGEGIDDLRPFDPPAFADALLGA